MGKLQPNFSWQKYQGKPEDQAEQFQKQLSTMHIVTANAINSTIDDINFWTRERPTGFTWVNESAPLWTKTLAIPSGASWVAGITNTIPIGITGDFTVVYMQSCISDGAVAASTTLNLPHIDVAVPANSVSITRIGTDIVLVSGGTNMSAFSGYVTIYFTKVR